MNFKHGLHKHPLYNIYTGMIQRCYNVDHKDYQFYGARGIGVCERWFDIKNFVEDMFPTYKTGLTIDRVNNDGIYEPSNCRWVTRADQNRNRRKK